jgi:hypothetical protein
LNADAICIRYRFFDPFASSELARVYHRKMSEGIKMSLRTSKSAVNRGEESKASSAKLSSKNMNCTGSSSSKKKYCGCGAVMYPSDDSFSKCVVCRAQQSRLRSFDSSTALKSKRPKVADDFLHTKKLLKYVKTLADIPEENRKSLVLADQTESEATALASFTHDDVVKHSSALRIEQVQRLMRPVLAKLLHHPRNANIFNKPVDPEALEIPDYFTKIKHPMDLGTVRNRLQRGLYETVAAVVADIHLTFKNATTFNPESHGIHQIAKLLNEDFDQDVVALFDRIAKEVRQTDS